ncbi:hypothetical protein GCM10027043_47310 [Ferruginibacter profundus]
MIASSVVAQNGGNEEDHTLSKFWKKLKVRKAFETGTKDDDKAANLSFTFPKGKPNSFVINAGIGYQFGDRTKKTKNNKAYKEVFSGFFVYNQNNEIEKEQKNYKAGMSFSQAFYTNIDESQAHFVEYALEYLRDFYDTSHSVLFTSYWHPFSKKPGGIILGGYAQTAKRVLFYLHPQAGIEYQNVFTAKAAADEGYDLRGFFSLGGNLLFKKKTYDSKNGLLNKEFWTKGIELKITYDGRVDISNSIAAAGESYVPMFKGELIFYPTQNNKFTIGLSYNDGANPLDGIAKQTFWLLAFKFKK